MSAAHYTRNLFRSQDAAWRRGQPGVGAYLRDELQLHLAPVLLGGGIRSFDGLGPEHVELETTRLIDSPGVTHGTFRLVR